MNHYKDYVRKSLFRYTLSIVSALFVLMALFYVCNILWFSVGKNRSSNKKISAILNEQMQSYMDGIDRISEEEPIRMVLSDYTNNHFTEANRILYDYSNSQKIRCAFCLVNLENRMVCSNLYDSNQTIFLGSDIFENLTRKIQTNTSEIFIVPSGLYYQCRQAGDILLGRGVTSQGKLIGYLFFDAYDEGIYQILKDYQLDDIMITDRYGNLFFSLGRKYMDPLDKYPTNRAIVSTGSGITTIDGKDYHVSVSSLENSSLMLYTLISTEYQTNIIKVGLWFFVILGLLMVTLLFPLNKKITDRNLKAVEELRKSIEEIGNGNMDYELQKTAFSEFKELHTAYRNVIMQREELLKANSELVERKRIMEIKQLEEQFNPHFIYNVLETLRYEIQIDAKQASEMVVAFASLMRYSINYGNELVPLETDIQYISDYLLLQKIRYNKRLEYHISIPSELMDIKIPKLVLQPVVENSLGHGLKNVDSITVWIEAREKEGNLELIVRDNGGGIETARLRELQESLEQEDEQREHIGMYNSHRVVRLIYGQEYGLRIESMLGKGTTVCITMPIDMEM